eukprot:m.3688 g.3688  ORF g.3688 m.3688 type:complete len:56 (+) comp2980_c0_seq1:162-329(+)
MSSAYMCTEHNHAALPVQIAMMSFWVNYTGATAVYLQGVSTMMLVCIFGCTDAVH